MMQIAKKIFRKGLAWAEALNSCIDEASVAQIVQPYEAKRSSGLGWFSYIRIFRVSQSIWDMESIRNFLIISQ